MVDNGSSLTPDQVLVVFLISPPSQKKEISKSVHVLKHVRENSRSLDTWF